MADLKLSSDTIHEAQRGIAAVKVPMLPKVPAAPTEAHESLNNANQTWQRELDTLRELLEDTRVWLGRLDTTMGTMDSAMGKGLAR